MNWYDYGSSSNLGLSSYSTGLSFPKGVVFERKDGLWDWIVWEDGDTVLRKGTERRVGIAMENCEKEISCYHGYF